MDSAAVRADGQGLPGLGGRARAVDAKRLGLGDAWFFAVVLAAAALPFAFPVFPSQDGPSHLGTSAILGRLWLDRDPHFAAFFEAVPPTTNSLVHYLGLPLVRLFPAVLAEKFLVAGLIVGGAAAVWGCVRALAGPNAWLSAFAAAGAYTLTLYTGNYNFILSFVLFFLILRETLRRGGGIGWRGAFRLGALFLLAALAHPVGTVFAAVVVAVLVLWRAWLVDGLNRAAILRQGPVAVAILPALALLLLYLVPNLDTAAEHGSGVQFGPGLLARLKSFAGLRQLYTAEDRLQLALCLLAAVTLEALALSAMLRRARELWAGATWRFDDGVLLAALASLVLYLAIPDGGAGAGAIASRLDFVPWLLVLVWLGTRRLGAWERMAALVLAGPLSLGLLLTNAVAIGKVEPELVALHEADALLRPGWTVLSLMGLEKPIWTRPGEGFLQDNPFMHLQHRAAADRGIVMLNNWNAHYHSFPVQFRAEADPYRLLGDPTSFDPKDFAGFERRTGQRIDAVIAWGMPPAEFAAKAPALQAELAALFCRLPMPLTAGTLFGRRQPDGSCPNP